MSSVLIRRENEIQLDFEDIISEMKKEILKKIESKTIEYNFDFKGGMPLKGEKIIWSERGDISKD